MIFGEKLLEIDTNGSKYVVETYEQPLKNYVFSYVYSLYALNICKLPGTQAFENLQWKWHDRNCNDDCGEATEVATGLRIKTCSFIPWTVKQDLRYFDLTQRNRTRIGELAYNSEATPN